MNNFLFLNETQNLVRMVFNFIWIQRKFENKNKHRPQKSGWLQEGPVLKDKTKVHSHTSKLAQLEANPGLLAKGMKPITEGAWDFQCDGNSSSSVQINIQS